MKIVVDHVSGSRRGQRQEFRSVTRLRFGRHPDNEISFDAHRDLDASSRHAELRRKGRSYVLHDVGSSNGTFVDGEQREELALEKGSARIVEFGEGGPRVRIWIGGLDDDPGPPPSTERRGLSDMVRAAAREAQSRGGGTATAGSVARHIWARSSWRLRLVFAMIVLLILAGAVGLLLWRASERDREVEEQRQSDRERARRDREQELLRARDEFVQPGGKGHEIARRTGKALIDLVWSSSDEEGEQPAPERFCTAFAVSDGWVATAASCTDKLEELRGEGRRVYGVGAGGDAIELGPARAHAAAPIRLLAVAGSRPTVDLAADPTEVEAGTNVFLFWYPEIGGAGDGGEPEIAFGPVSGLDREARTLRHGLEAPEITAGAPVFDGSGAVVAIQLADGNKAVRADALRELMRETSAAGAGVDDAGDPGSEQE